MGGKHPILFVIACVGSFFLTEGFEVFQYWFLGLSVFLLACFAIQLTTGLVDGPLSTNGRSRLMSKRDGKQSLWAGGQKALTIMKTARYISMYMGIVVLIAIFFTMAFVSHLYGGVRASRVLHQNLIGSVLRTTMRLFQSSCPASNLYWENLIQMAWCDSSVPHYHKMHPGYPKK